MIFRGDLLFQKELGTNLLYFEVCDDLLESLNLFIFVNIQDLQILIGFLITC